MKKYTHDYTKVSEAENHLYAAQQLNAHDDPVEAWKHIEDARQLLQQYLAQDNIVEDDDVENGWVHHNEAQAEIDRLNNLNRHYLETLHAQGRVAMEIARRSEELLREKEHKS